MKLKFNGIKVLILERFCFGLLKHGLTKYVRLRLHAMIRHLNESIDFLTKAATLSIYYLCKLLMNMLGLVHTK